MWSSPPLPTSTVINGWTCICRIRHRHLVVHTVGAHPAIRVGDSWDCIVRLMGSTWAGLQAYFVELDLRFSPAHSRFIDSLVPTVDVDVEFAGAEKLLVDCCRARKAILSTTYLGGTAVSLSAIWASLLLRFRPSLRTVEGHC